MATSKQIKKLRDRLVSVAKAKSRVAYSEVDYLVGLDVTYVPLDRGRLGSILAGIGAEEKRNRRPFLPAVVVRKHSRRPGPGFYGEARARYSRYSRIASNTALHDAVLDDVYRHSWK